jgi:hypothetical protein
MPTFAGLKLSVFYDPFEFLAGTCPTPTGKEIVILHLCALGWAMENE